MHMNVCVNLNCLLCEMCMLFKKQYVCGSWELQSEYHNTTAHTAEVCKIYTSSFRCVLTACWYAIL